MPSSRVIRSQHRSPGFFEYTYGDYKNGERHLRQAFELRKSLGTDTADYAESANDLALFCRDSAKLPEGRTLAEQTVAIRSRLLGAADLRVAESLDTLGSIAAHQGDYDLAPAVCAKLEQSGLLTVSAPVSERFNAALDEAAHRLMGASFESIKHDPAARDRILEDAMSGFCRLSHADEDRLIAELERIAGVSIDDAISPAADLADAMP
jgi:hypothetical protein